MGRPRKKKISKSSSPRARYQPKKKSKKRGPAAPVEKLPSGPPRKPRKSRASSSKDSNQQRLQKVLAAAGIGSRRECESFIIEGRVEIDGQVVTELGTTVDPLLQEIRMDGDALKRFKPIYYIVNKPSGVLSTNSDPAGRMRVIDLVPPGTRLFTVGRLDKASEGLMLVTNDGELANRLAHPRYGVEKTYHVIVAGHPSGEALKTLRRGIHLAEGVVRVSRLSVKKRLKQSTQLEMVLSEGRNREIRRMAAYIEHKVVSLKRIGLGTLRLGTMPTGSYRPLTEPELKRLRALCYGNAKSKSVGRPRRAAAGKTAGKSRSSAGGKSKTASARGAKATTGTSSRRTTKKKTTKKKTTKASAAVDSSRGRGKAAKGKKAKVRTTKGQKKKRPTKLGKKTKGAKPKSRKKSKR